MKLRCRLSFHDWTMWSPRVLKRVKFHLTLGGIDMDSTRERQVYTQVRTCKDCNFTESRMTDIGGSPI